MKADAVKILEPKQKELLEQILNSLKIKNKPLFLDGFEKAFQNLSFDFKTLASRFKWILSVDKKN